MPSNVQYADFLDDFLQGIDPIDAATLFAGLRNTVPLSMLFRHGELGPEEMTELNAINPRRAPTASSTGNQPSPDRLEMTPSQIEMQNIAFNMQYRDPRVFGIHPDKPSINNQMLRAMMDEYNRQGRDPFSKETATRRKDFEEAPMSAQQYVSAAPKRKKFANGGAIDFSIPDMQDGGRFIPDPQPFSKGGGVKKTLDQMMAEMAQKGVKVADKPDLARRGFMGLSKASDFPLAKLDKDMFKNAPAITEKTVTVDPGKGAAKSTLKSLSETPMSRREVLQSAAGQAMRGVLPELGGLSSLGNVAKAVESVAPEAAPVLPQTLQGLIAHFAKKGLDEDATIKKLEKLGYDEDDVLYMLHPMRNPDEYLVDYFDGESKAPSYVLSNLINTGFDKPPMTMRGPLREIKRENPDMYKDLMRIARDISEYGFE